MRLADFAPHSLRPCHPQLVIRSLPLAALVVTTGIIPVGLRPRLPSLPGEGGKKFGIAASRGFE